MELAEILGKRILLVSGKGGVGRTVFAAAAALAAAGAGRRVLLLEIGDPEGGDSPLAALFDRPRFSPHPQPLAERLSACHLWAPLGHLLFLQQMLPGGALLGAALRSRALQSFLCAAPSFLELGWFYHLLTLIRAERSPGVPEHELLVLDMPATGHALALTGLPEIIHRLMPGGPIPRAMREGQSWLNDRQRAAAWVVTLPETLPVSEAIELVAGLRQTGVPVGGIVLNRYPADPFSPGERQALAAALQGRQLFGALAFQRVARSRAAEARLLQQLDLPVVRVAELEAEGLPLCQAIAARLAAGPDRAPAPAPALVPQPAGGGR